MDQKKKGQFGPVVLHILKPSTPLLPRLFFGVGDVAVLDAEDDVGAGAATGGLLEKLLGVQGGGQA